MIWGCFLFKWWGKSKRNLTPPPKEELLFWSWKCIWRKKECFSGQPLLRVYSLQTPSLSFSLFLGSRTQLKTKGGPEREESKRRVKSAFVFCKVPWLISFWLFTQRLHEILKTLNCSLKSNNKLLLTVRTVLWSLFLFLNRRLTIKYIGNSWAQKGKLNLMWESFGRWGLVFFSWWFLVFRWPFPRFEGFSVTLSYIQQSKC